MTGILTSAYSDNIITVTVISPGQQSSAGSLFNHLTKSFNILTGQQRNTVDIVCDVSVLWTSKKITVRPVVPQCRRWNFYFSKIFERRVPCTIQRFDVITVFLTHHSDKDLAEMLTVIDHLTASRAPVQPFPCNTGTGYNSNHPFSTGDCFQMLNQFSYTGNTVIHPTTRCHGRSCFRFFSIISDMIFALGITNSLLRMVNAPRRSRIGHGNNQHQINFRMSQ